MMQREVGEIDGPQEEDWPWTSTRMLLLIQNCHHYLMLLLM